MIKIIVKNLFTFFNILNFALAALVIAAGSYENALFLGVVISNLAISAAQEIRAKKTLERLTLIHEPRRELSAGDEITVKSGEQIPADCVVISGECGVNESPLTGEAEPVSKKSGDELLSGSYAVSGAVNARVTKTGADSFAGKITAEARAVKIKRSEIFRALDKIVKLISVIILPAAIVLFKKNSVVGAAAAVIGMIPEGLILLTGIVFAVTAVRLAKIGVMARDLYSAEPLAKMSVLCLDKTGTITEGVMRVEEFTALDNCAVNDLASFVSLFPDKNPTFAAIADYSGISGEDVQASEIVNFTSEKKRSSAVINGKEYVLQAGENEDLSRKGLRVLEFFRDNRKIAVIGLGDKIRDNITETLNWFYRNSIDVKIISGDSPETVKAIAEKAGVRNPENSVYGRATPKVKREIVSKLRKGGAVAGMVGDGVNDILALKEADIGISLKSGSDAARRAATLTLLNDDLSALTRAIAESRRAVNNLTRSASLFLTKTVYSMILAAVFVFADLKYPIIPIQATLIGGLFIGLPAFLLALENNAEKVTGRFFTAVLRKAAPMGAAIAAIVLIFRDKAFIALAAGSLAALIITCFPVNGRRALLIAATAVLFTAAAFIFKDILQLGGLS